MMNTAEAIDVVRRNISGIEGDAALKFLEDEINRLHRSRQEINDKYLTTVVEFRDTFDEISDSLTSVKVELLEDQVTQFKGD